jgi:hypothetical protein
MLEEKKSAIIYDPYPGLCGLLAATSGINREDLEAVYRRRRQVSVWWRNVDREPTLGDSINTRERERHGESP